ncbi:MAG: STAS domain-containing protein [Thermoguttaceae bacterium]
MCSTNRPVGVETITDSTGELEPVDDRSDGKAILVDCSSVQVLSSEILGKLLLLQWQMKQKGARLVLSGLRAEVREVLCWTKIDRLFAIR